MWEAAVYPGPTNKERRWKRKRLCPLCGLKRRNAAFSRTDFANVERWRMFLKQRGKGKAMQYMVSTASEPPKEAFKEIVDRRWAQIAPDALSCTQPNTRWFGFLQASRSFLPFCQEHREALLSPGSTPRDDAALRKKVVSERFDMWRARRTASYYF